MTSDAVFTPFTINNVRFKNRILRSSVGGRMANYDGTVTDVWKNFEKRFADGGVGAIISTTFHVDEDRVSPLQYPSIARDRYVPYLAKYIAQIRRPRDGSDCKYIVQLGDPGYCTYTSLFPEESDAASSSFGFDPVFGYNNLRSPMTVEQIEQSIENFANAAERVRNAGADGLEITATKGYLIQQFLNPGYNTRSDEWGGNADNRFRFLQRIVQAVRARVGRDFLFGIRLSGTDFNYVPLVLMLFRLPSILRSREAWMGNEMEQMIAYAKRLRELGVDYLHVVSGYGFPNPHDVPGTFPYDEVKIFFNTTRHLSFKAWLRCALLNLPPAALMRWVLNLGWVYKPAINLEYARRFKQEVGLPVIANGGFQEKQTIESALDSGGCDMVSMARALIANPDLPQRFARGLALEKPCTHCNRCVGRTGTSPLGCYEPARFDNSTRRMLLQIMEWNQPDPA